MGGRLKMGPSRSRASPHAHPDHQNALTFMISISHPIHTATKAFGLRTTQASPDKKASCKANFTGAHRQWLPAEWKGRLKGSAFGDIFTGPEKTQSWTVHPARFVAH